MLDEMFEKVFVCIVVGFRGTVTVTDLKTKVVPIVVSVNGITADHTDYLVNGSLIEIIESCDEIDVPDDGWDIASYLYSVCVTPLITNIIPPVVHLGEEIRVEGDMFADDPFSDTLNTLTIGGKPCLLSTDARPSSVLSRDATTLNDTDIGSKETLKCIVPKQPPGMYRVVVHVGGRGWAFGYLWVSTLMYQVAVSLNVSSGSIHGGTEVTIPGVGFHPGAALGNRVKFGNAICDVQSLTESDDWGKGGSLTCITRKTLDDGYSVVVKEDVPLGYWELNDREMVGELGPVSLMAMNSGSLGPRGQGSFTGLVEVGVDGISGNHHTNRAVQFNDGWVTVPYVPELNSQSNVSGELWLKAEYIVSAYQFVLGSYSRGTVAEGYVIWINPCGHVEFWLAVNAETSHNESTCGYFNEDATMNSSGSIGVAGVGSNLNSCEQCNEIRTVSWQESEQSGLPAGVWSVVSGPEIGNSWSHVVFSWSLNESSLEPAVGSQLLYVVGQLVDSRETNFSRNLGSPLLFGGQPSLGASTTLEQFAGVVDEVALYGQPLSEDAIARHFDYGMSDLQPVVLQYDMEDHRGIGTVPNVWHVVLSCCYFSLLMCCR